MLGSDLRDASGKSVAAPGVGRELFGIDGVAETAIGGRFEKGQVAEPVD